MGVKSISKEEKLVKGDDESAKEGWWGPLSSKSS